MEQHSGLSVQSGNGTTTTFTISHGGSFEPYFAMIKASSADALGTIIYSPGTTHGNDPIHCYTYTVNSTDIIINYPVAPPTGTNNLSWYWITHCN